MISITQQGLEDIFRFKIKTSATLEFLPAKVVAQPTEKSELFFANLISAMANSNGGCIFIGITSMRRTAKSIEPIKSEDSIDWLRMICSTKISPEIPNCLIEKIPVSNSGEYVIGIEIPNSHVAPHMSADNRFYRRSETRTVLMEEYEVRDLYTKGKRAEIELYSVTNTNGIPIISGGKYEKVNFYPRFLVKNTGNCIERFYKVEISIPSAINNPNFNSMADYFSRFDDGCSIYSFMGKSALFQGEIATVVEPNLIVDINNFKTFETGEITLKFFYSSGVQTKTFHCKELLLYKNRCLDYKDFVKSASILMDVVH